MKNIVAAVVVAIGIIIACWLIGDAYKYKFKTTENISVTGLAEKDFESDLIVWSGNYSRKNLDIKMAYSQLKDDETKVNAYLKTKGILDSEIVFSSVDIEKDFDDVLNEKGDKVNSIFTGYELKQSVTIQSKNIDTVEKVSREITQLIDSDIAFSSTAPSYYYSKLPGLKLDLLAEASADAKDRAQIIAKNSGSVLGDVKKETMGVFQITGQNTNEDYSGGGNFNTSSRMKTATITIKVDYAVN
jgi:uncharacterized protein